MVPKIALPACSYCKVSDKDNSMAVDHSTSNFLKCGELLAPIDNFLNYLMAGDYICVSNGCSWTAFTPYYICLLRLSPSTSGDLSILSFPMDERSASATSPSQLIADEVRLFIGSSLA